jgi:hypothetical protein
MPIEEGESKEIRYQVRLSPSTAQAVDKAAAAEGIPVSTWIRHQIVASLYLAGVREAPQVIYQGIRYALKPELDQMVWARVAVDALIGALPEVLAMLLPRDDPRAPGDIEAAMRAILAERTRELVAEDLEE